MPGHLFDQSSYQVRLDWGVDGLVRVAPSDVIVVVDVLRFSSTVIQAVENGKAVELDAAAHAVSINGAAVAEAAAGSGATVLLGGLRNASAVARAVMTIQHHRGDRTSIAVIACGERVSADAVAPLRFAVEDLMGAGAVVDALAELGIDHSSPDAAVAGEGFRALRGAARHLVTASGSGRELEAAGRRDEVLAAAAVDAASVVPVLREGAFEAF
ncbi:2-phosphosulfolactate phosphatase [Microbacterium sp. CFH 31415]|uniref:2-phosphosulfolactate phosphatase n=1 Tax=Microbacterium sp. CFH 31415 TaxID=2921732 RepID=UPI001F137FE8|nr:2-phosphosulfolactate phosphatase [Microbacterium sp. CFH 31415]MCH6232012.1 2-phosphosulfolactate phosphatase [Microbacterium sp. CFH 31415]